MHTAMSLRQSSIAEKRRILRLETLYDLAVALHAHGPEQDLVDELLQRVCAVLDPAAAAAVTRDAYGAPLATASVGWPDAPPASGHLLADPLWRELLTGGEGLSRRDGELAGRRYRELIAAPLTYRGVFLGFLALLDKEERGGAGPGFTEEDRRFLGSVAALAGVALDSARQVADLQAQRERLEEENKALRERWAGDVAGHRIVAQAPPMRRALEMVERVAPRGVPVLLRGESGTGKELAAKLLHLLSQRSGSLIALNCAALPESLLESELFGIEGGVATGVRARRGKFELADGGTLFLDEIGDLQLPLQVKLLRSLQEREITRVGGSQPVRVEVRLVAATHRDLEAMIVGGQFREDLYYRLKGVEIGLPSLRERRADIPHLVHQFAEEFCRREGIAAPRFGPEALSFLIGQDYPGNVRELRNLVEAAVSLADGEIDLALLHTLKGAAQPAAGPEPLDLVSVERRHIARVLRLTGGNKSQAAALLGLDRRTLQRKGF